MKEILLVFGIIIAFIAGFLSIALPGEKYMEKLMSSCLADGKQEYECYSMIYRRH